jgi:transcriptional regulator with XRE-family HTH domain
MLLAKNLRFLRSQVPMTQSELAEKLGLQRTMISAYEDGRSEPKLSSLEIMARLFQVSMDELLFHDIQEMGRKAVQNRTSKS